MIFTIKISLNINAHDLDLVVKYGGKSQPFITDIDFATEGSRLNLGNLGNCWKYWNWIKESKKQLNVLKSEELRTSARLLEKYPRVVKKPLDPSQGPPLSNSTHNIVMLENLAIKSLNERNVYHNWDRNQCMPGTYQIQLVPYDRYLWLLLDTLTHHPLDSEVDGLDKSLTKVSLKNEEQGSNPASTALPNAVEKEQSAFQYPEKIAESLRTVLKGLMYIYTETPLTVPRIQWNDTKNASSSEKWPAFCVDNGRHEHAPFEQRCVNQHIKPHDKREYEWLTAFAEAVTWIELNIGPANMDL